MLTEKELLAALRQGVTDEARAIVAGTDEADAGLVHHMLFACTETRRNTCVIDSAVDELAAMAEGRADVREAPRDIVVASAAAWASMFLRRYVIELSRELESSGRVL